MKRILVGAIAGVLTVIALQPAAAQGVIATGDQGTPVVIPNFDRPIDPDVYRIRPGERLEVVFVNTKLPNLQLLVDAEGYIVDRSLGVMPAAERTLTDLRETLKQVLSRLFTADDIRVSVTSVYPVRILVTGAVKRPGTYMGYTSQRVSDVIDSAGGIVEGGSRRFITFREGAGLVPVDLDAARIAGDERKNPRLYAGSVVVVPYQKTSPVLVSGEVANPGFYEVVEGETWNDLVAYAGGPVADPSDPSEMHLINDPLRDLSSDRVPRPGDHLAVNHSRWQFEIVVSGAVSRPVRFEAGVMTLEAALQRAGGLTSDANGERIAVFRRLVSDQTVIPLSGRYPLLTAGQDPAGFELLPGDSVVVPSAVGYVVINGDIVGAGYYPWVAGQVVRYYLDLAGGVARDVQISVRDRITGLSRSGEGQAIVRDGDEIKVTAPEVLP